MVSLYLKSERPGGGSDLCGGGSLYIIYYTISYILNIIFQKVKGLEAALTCVGEDHCSTYGKTLRNKER